MRADCMSRGDYLFEDFWMPHSVLADGKEQSLGALICKRFEDRLCISGPWAVVESQHHLAFAKEIVSLELLETETWAARGIDLNDTRDAERIRILADGLRGGGVGHLKCCNACERSQRVRRRRGRRPLPLDLHGDPMRRERTSYQCRLINVCRFDGRDTLRDRQRPTKDKAHPSHGHRSGGGSRQNCYPTHYLPPTTPSANAVVHEQHDQLRSVNIWFAWPVRGGPFPVRRRAV